MSARCRQRIARAVHRRDEQDPRRPGAARRAAVRDQLRHPVRRLPGARRADLRAAAGAGHPRSSWSPRRSPTPCARRRTSWSGWRPSACRWPGWCSTGCRRSGCPTCPRRRPRPGPSACGEEHHWSPNCCDCTPTGWRPPPGRPTSRGSFTGAHPRVPVASVIALADDVHDLDGLRTSGTCWRRADAAGAGSGAHAAGRTRGLLVTVLAAGRRRARREPSHRAKSGDDSGGLPHPSRRHADDRLHGRPQICEHHPT